VEVKGVEVNEVKGVSRLLFIRAAPRARAFDGEREREREGVEGKGEKRRTGAWFEGARARAASVRPASFMDTPRGIYI